ncbi:uncharacterized protein LOC129762909 isoform X2 [Toxorhynchites rutilus septentrionalis]|uniref:uncharacterized protein LOC129762909 isoform X2 n=1 Tax=Toxorhynchites rutilus septentrionalis TaxID=329112 RepID=UPI00247A5CC9|nr:uncharacterized protein LOC129762909 isoform X2 [Toxorhynchites rutilus septentrionalis]
MSSSGPLRPHPAETSGPLECVCRSGPKMAAGFASLCSSSSSSLISYSTGQAIIQPNQHQATATKSRAKAKPGRARTAIISIMTPTRVMSGFMFNFHFLLSIVLFIVLFGDLARLRTTDFSAGFGVLAEESNEGAVTEEALGETATPEPFDLSKRGIGKFGDKCESTTECGFAGSVCHPTLRTCQCTPDLPTTNHLDKCGKKAQVNESCFFTEQCETMTEQTECRDGRCICRFEMNPIFKPDGTVECRATMNKPIEPEKYIDPTMIGVLVAMAVMFIIICVVLRLFSKARWRDNRTIFNTPNPRLMNVSLLRDNKLLHGQERRGSRMSVRLPSRQPSMASLRPHSPNASIGSRRGSRGSSNASASSNRSQHAKDNGTAHPHQNESVTVEIAEIRS